MYSHSRDDDLDTFVPQRGDCLTEGVMLIRVVAVEQAHLDDRDFEWVGLGIKCNSKACPHAVIQTSPHALTLDASFLK